MTDLKVLIKKLSASSRTSLEQSANLCVNHQNFEIEIEHFFFFVKLLEQQSNDLELLLNKYKISKDALLTDLLECISQLPKGNTRTPIFFQINC